MTCFQKRSGAVVESPYEEIFSPQIDDRQNSFHVPPLEVKTSADKNNAESQQYNWDEQEVLQF